MSSARRPPPRPRAARAPRLAAGLAVAAAVLCTGESWFRAHPPPSPTQVPPAQAGDATILNGSPWLLWELIPGDHHERGGHVHVNAAGFRDRDDRGPKVRRRVLALGDSSVYGFGNDDEEVFTSRLESTFSADFINGAVPGYSTFQSLNSLRARGLALDPDVLLVGNLWSDNNFDNFVDRDLLSTYAGWEESPSVRLRTAFGHSALFRALDWELRVKDTAPRTQKVGWQVGGTAARSGNRRVAIADYAANLATFCTIAAGRGGGVVFLLLANREDLHPQSGDPAWAPYREVMRTTAAACNAPLVDVPAAFYASGKSADALFLDEMHPTPIGQAVVAEAVAHVLQGVGWPQTPLHVQAPAPIAVPDDRFEGHGAAAEAEGLRPGALQLALTLRPNGPVTLTARDADAPPQTAPLAVAEVSAEDAADGTARVSLQLSRTPGRVVVEASYAASPAGVVVTVRSTALPVAPAVLALDLR